MDDELDSDDDIGVEPRGQLLPVESLSKAQVAARQRLERLRELLIARGGHLAETYQLIGDSSTYHRSRLTGGSLERIGNRFRVLQMPRCVSDKRPTLSKLSTACFGMTKGLLFAD